MSLPRERMEEAQTGAKQRLADTPIEQFYAAADMMYDHWKKLIPSEGIDKGTYTQEGVFSIEIKSDKEHLKICFNSESKKVICESKTHNSSNTNYYTTGEFSRIATKLVDRVVGISPVP